MAKIDYKKEEGLIVDLSIDELFKVQPVYQFRHVNLRNKSGAAPLIVPIQKSMKDLIGNSILEHLINKVNALRNIVIDPEQVEIRIYVLWRKNK